MLYVFILLLYQCNYLELFGIIEKIIGKKWLKHVLYNHQSVENVISCLKIISKNGSA